MLFKNKEREREIEKREIDLFIRRIETYHVAKRKNKNIQLHNKICLSD